MMSKWQVTSNYVGGKTMFGVYRLRNVNEVDHSGNREVYTYDCKSIEEARRLADALNLKEEAEEDEE